MMITTEHVLRSGHLGRNLNYFFITGITFVIVVRIRTTVMATQAQKPRHQAAAVGNLQS